MRAALPHTEGFVDRDGVNIHYEVYGDGPETLYFIPTWAIIHSRAWKAQIPYFSERFRVITHDPRGNGKSDRPNNPEEYSLDRAVDDVLAVMDHLGVDKASVAGLSYSGMVASVLAAHHPERIKSLIGIGSFTTIVPGFSYRENNFESVLKDPQGWEKYNKHYWQTDYADFCAFFMSEIFSETHSTKQFEDSVAWSAQGDGEMLAMSIASRSGGNYVVDEAMYGRIKCPAMYIHGTGDRIAPVEMSRRAAELSSGEFVLLEGAGHCPQARIPARINTLMRDFLAQHLGTWSPRIKPAKTKRAAKKILYLSSPIGLGHARRDLAITQEMRHLYPDIQVDWLAQDPVTRFLQANDETIHPDSGKLANESSHIEAESGEHDLNAFQAIRNMDEILTKNFMVFQEAVEQDTYDLVIADEAWDVDHYWHEHPDLKKAQIAWLTDFVGWVPMPGNGPHEASLTTDYNQEMIGHIEDNPGLRDRAIFVGNPSDIIPHSFGENLPQMRDWVPKNFDFCGYVLGRHPKHFGERDALRNALGYQSDEKICIVTVGGSSVGGDLIRRILAAYPMAKARIPQLRMIVVAGPRLDTTQFKLPKGVEIRAFVPDLDRHLAACDLALVQGGLTTSMELAAAGTPFLYFPLKNHFEQNFHVAHRLDQYGAGRRMIYDESTPEKIAQAMLDELSMQSSAKPVEADGAARAAYMLSELL